MLLSIGSYLILLLNNFLKYYSLYGSYNNEHWSYNIHSNNTITIIIAAILALSILQANAVLLLLEQPTQDRPMRLCESDYRALVTIGNR